MSKVKIPDLPLTGGCQCGAVRYELTGPPEVFYICHCTECQKQSSSAFGESFRVQRSDLHVTGSMAAFERGSESGANVVCEFCPKCGSRLFHGRAAYGETINIKAGTLDDTSWLVPAGHIWTKSKQPWVAIGDGELAYEHQPADRDAALIAKWRSMLET